MKNSETSEYHVSHFNGAQTPDSPNGPLYGKMVDDLKKIQSAVSQWKVQEELPNGKSDSSLSYSEVIEKLATIEAGVAHWHASEEANRHAESQWEWQDRQDELEALELNHARAGRGLLFAKAMLATNQDVLWATLFLLHVNREKQAMQLLEECVDPVTPMPPIIRKCFDQLGVSEDGSMHKGLRHK
jgi:hypothetical protein